MATHTQKRGRSRNAAASSPTTPAPAEVTDLTAARKARKPRKAGPTQADIDTAVEQLAQELEAAGAKVTTKARKAAAAPAVLEEQPKSKSIPWSERRNETRHPDGHAAMEGFGCPTCKARKGQLCIRRDGERTNYVHSTRLARWDAS